MKEQTPITAEEKKRVAKEMSKRDWKDKEQTPITAEGLYDDKMGSDSVWKEDCVELMEQYAEIVSQAKVLEALEWREEFYPLREYTPKELYELFLESKQK